MGGRPAKSGESVAPLPPLGAEGLEADLRDSLDDEQASVPGWRRRSLRTSSESAREDRCSSPTKGAVSGGRLESAVHCSLGRRAAGCVGMPATPRAWRHKTRRYSTVYAATRYCWRIRASLPRTNRAPAIRKPPLARRLSCLTVRRRLGAAGTDLVRRFISGGGRRHQGADARPRWPSADHR